MIGGGGAKENTQFSMDSCQWPAVLQRISAGRRAHATHAEEGGKDSTEEAAAVVCRVLSRRVCGQEAAAVVHKAQRRCVCRQAGMIATRQPWLGGKAGGAFKAQQAAKGADVG